MTARHVLMAVGLLAASWLAFFADKTPGDGIAEPMPRATAIPGKREALITHAGGGALATPGESKDEVVILALQPRDALLGDPLVAGPEAGLFSQQSWVPPAPPPPKPAPPPPPSAPPLPFTYLGKKMEDNKWEAYLSRGEQTFIVHDREVLEGVYRVDSIRPPLLSFTYLPLNQVQTLAIGGIE